MTTLGAFTHDNIRDVRKDIDAALSTVAQKYNIVFAVGRITFGHDEFRCKLEAGLKTKVGDSDLSGVPGNFMWHQAFKRSAIMYGMTLKDLGREFTYGKEKYIFVGLKERARRLPFLAQNVRTQKFHRFDEQLVKNCLGIK